MRACNQKRDEVARVEEIVEPGANAAVCPIGMGGLGSFLPTPLMTRGPRLPGISEFRPTVSLIPSMAGSAACELRR